MAEENEVRTEETPEEEQAQETTAKVPIFPPVVIRYAVLGAILIVILIGSLFLITDVIAPRLQRLNQTASAEGAAGEAAAAAAPTEPGDIILIRDIVVNPAGSGGRRYLKVTAAIEAHTPESEQGRGRGAAAPAAEEELTLREVRIRDLLIRELSARTLDELTDPLSKEEMRVGILAGLNDILAGETVSNVFFTEYVVQ